MVRTHWMAHPHDKSTMGVRLGISLVVLILMAGCEGPIGPEGPEGPPGPQGEDGEQGPPGNANVYYSDWMPFEISEWTPVTTFGKETQEYRIEEPLVSDNIIDQGAVLVYIRFGGSREPRPLPFLGYITSSSSTQHIWFRLLPGSFTLIFENLTNNNDPGTFGSSNSFRYVIIPGGAAIAANLKTLSYAQLRHLYDLDDR